MHRHQPRFVVLCVAQGLFLAASAMAQAPTSAAATESTRQGSDSAGESSTVAATKPKLEHVRATSTAKLTNLPDPKGIVLATVDKDAVLRVSEVRGTWLAVEPAAGIPVWIYGKYLVAEGQGDAKVLGTNVRMRPLPNTSAESYPLQQLLKGGEVLRVLARADASKPLSEDWVKVLAPAGTTAWIEASKVAALPAGGDGAAMLASERANALASLPQVSLPASAARNTASNATTANATTANATTANATGTAGTTTAAAAAKPSESAKAQDTGFAQAESLYEAARASSNPDWSAVKSAYESSLAANPKAASAETARVRLEEIELRMEVAQLEADKKLREQEREAQLSEAKRRLAAASLSQDPLWGRFQARGWLELDPTSDKNAPRYILRFGGKAVAEVVCATGRFDLSQYTGYEVGIMGTIVRGAIGESGTTSARPMRVDAARLEVISGRIARR
jgi:hypothetical protein